MILKFTESGFLGEKIRNWGLYWRCKRKKMGILAISITKFNLIKQKRPTPPPTPSPRKKSGVSELQRCAPTHASLLFISSALKFYRSSNRTVSVLSAGYAWLESFKVCFLWKYRSGVLIVGEFPSPKVKANQAKGENKALVCPSFFI